MTIRIFNPALYQLLISEMPNKFYSLGHVLRVQLTLTKRIIQSKHMRSLGIKSLAKLDRNKRIKYKYIIQTATNLDKYLENVGHYHIKRCGGRK